ncbi:MAG: 50S ribosomal protein L6 [Minisyncoccia bacterium]|jgi:large subunit ribosomal protein L6
MENKANQKENTHLLVKSRVGKQNLIIPAGVKVTLEAQLVKIEGPQGHGELLINDNFEVILKENTINLKPRHNLKNSAALWGTLTSLLKNMIMGVSEAFSKKLSVDGVGYKAEVQGQKLILSLGYSHTIELIFPETLKVSVEKNIITIAGCNKQTVGDFAALVHKQRKEDPYKGKGVHYVGRPIRRKAGKKVASTAG